MPYLTVAIPCGLVVEHRICADAEGEPVENGLDAIAAVSARGIYRGQLDALDLQRRLVIINDSSPAKRAAGICTIGNNNLKPVRETNENEFTRFTIYD